MRLAGNVRMTWTLLAKSSSGALRKLRNHFPDIYCILGNHDSCNRKNSLA